MKKILSLITALLLVFALAMFAACSGGSVADTGKIEGNYKEPTSEELNAALESIDASKLFGDMSAEDWKFGVNVSADLSASVKMGTTEMGSASVELSYLFNVAAGEAGLDMKGAGSVSATVKESMTEEDGSSSMQTMEATAKAYNDSEYVYLNATAKQTGKEDATIKGNLSFDTIMSIVGGYLPMAADEEVEGGLTSGFDLTEIVAMLDTYGLKLEMDNSNGLKIKLSASKETFDAIVDTVIGMMGVYDAEESESSFIQFTTAVFELYIQIDKDGKFVAVAANFNIVASVDASAMMSANAAADNNMTVTAKGVFAVEASSKTASLPADLNTYTEDLSALL